MTALVLRADALRLPLVDESVDLIVTSPPYFALRSYRDDGEHYSGQIGSEATPQAFLEALWAVTAECWRVLKPSGSMFVNLGDKRAGSGGHNNSGLATSTLTGSKAKLDHSYRQNTATRRNAPDRYNQAAFGRNKSKMLLPHRYAIGCEDGQADPKGIGWIVRQDQVWWKPNGVPESVKDRTRDSHEYWFHLTKNERYFSALDEIREQYNPATHAAGPDGALWREGPMAPTWGLNGSQSIPKGTGRTPPHPLGKLPDSVWRIASEPLSVPDELGVDHFAAFPSEWPRRLILGWSPSGVCCECSEGRRPAVTNERVIDHESPGTRGKTMKDASEPEGNARGFNAPGRPVYRTVGTITGYVCACTPYTDHAPTGKMWGGSENRAEGPTGKRHTVPERRPRRVYRFDSWTPFPTRPAVVLDLFGGTGTTAMVARALGRIGVSVDLSADYCRLAQWRIFQSGGAAKVRERTNRAAQGTML